MRRAGGTRWTAVGGWLLLALAFADWLALKQGWLRHPPALLAALVAGVGLLFLLRLLCLLVGIRRRQGRGRLLAEALLLAGVLLALGGGTMSWLLGLQGFIVLHEGEAVPLAEGSHLEELVTGPLSRREDLDLVLALAEVELVPAGNGFFFPRSHLRVGAAGGEPRELIVDSHHAGAAGSLRFFQGAFGFAPRIVLVRGDETLFDRVVPFTSQRRGPSGLSFEGYFTVERKELEVRGAVDLESMDEGFRGHATLTLEVLHQGTLLGHGNLLPGHFAELQDGYRVGFAGLERWSEIDLSRRHYGGVVATGVAAALVGAVLWPLAAWRGW